LIAALLVNAWRFYFVAHSAACGFPGAGSWRAAFARRRAAVFVGGGRGRGTAMLKDAKNERVAAWYASYRALPLLDAPFSLLLPLETIATALRAGESL